VGRYRVAAPPNHVQFLQDRLQPEPIG
jgi:hypothetical protein